MSQISYEDELYGLLKGAEETPTDEDKSTATTVEVKEPPNDRQFGKLDSPWGEKGPEDGQGNPDPVQVSDAVAEQAEEDGQGTVDRLFSSNQIAAQVDQKLMAENFEHVSSGQFTTHSLQLANKQKEKVASYYSFRTLTLPGQIRKLVGRY